MSGNAVRSTSERSTRRDSQRRGKSPTHGEPSHDQDSSVSPQRASSSDYAPAPRFEAKSAMLYLVTDSQGDQEWREKDHGIGTIFFSRDYMWLDHSFLEDVDPFRVACYVRVIEPRSIVFRSESKSGPKRIALRLKSRSLLDKFLEFAYRNSIEVSLPKKYKKQEQTEDEMHEKYESWGRALAEERRRRNESHSYSAESYYTRKPPADSYTHYASTQHSRNTSRSSRRSGSRSFSEPAYVSSQARQLPLALVVIPKHGQDRLMRKAGFTTTSVELPPGLSTLTNRIVLCDVTNLPTVSALLFVGEEESTAEVLMFDRDVNSGYQIDAEENFGLEPISTLGKMPNCKGLRTADAAALMRRIVKEALSEAMYKEIGQMLKGALGPGAKVEDYYNQSHYDL